ncbi:hypothetical protein [Sutcliffiella deserti]|uniref:hypothetical protein n=1 Tax=Sutcliffiella deserti TaxID=2875501 RepID=UPI001CBF9516|nr:hypothetical protein [Sutcliffiella deserti]
MVTTSRMKSLSLVILTSILLLLGACSNENNDTSPADNTKEPEHNNTGEETLKEKEEKLQEITAEIKEKETQLKEVNNELEAKRKELAAIEKDIEEREANENGQSDEVEIKEKADSVVIGLENEDFGTVAAHAHPEKGVRFSPYGYVDTEKHLQFTKGEIRGFSEDNTKYTWGTQDGSGHQIELTPKEYYEEYIYIRDFSRFAQEINYNNLEQRGNIILNVEEVYPDAKFMEYYVSAEEDSLNWASLILAFEKHEEEWYLVGIIVDRWTI